MLGLITLSLFAGYILAAYFIFKVQKSKRNKIIAATIIILIPTWDVIIGRTMLYTLCATEGGIHVYQTVELGPQYFDKDGVPLFYDRKKVFIKMSLAGRYIGVSDLEWYVPNFFNIKKRTHKILDKSNAAIIGEIRYFIYFGGWAFNMVNTGASSGDRCPAYSDERLINLTVQVFKRVDA